MSTKVPLDLTLTALDDEERTLDDWLTTFQIAAVVVDPYTHESAWILDTARRILGHYRGADCRVCFVVAGTTEEATQFLGPITKEFMTLADPGRKVTEALGLEVLPAFVHLGQDGTVLGAAGGWDPQAWRTVAKGLAARMSWTAPPIPAAGDPVAYPGSPALEAGAA
ncbi:hypothetical protein [Actinomarinicola tropica]|uniref:Redoxin domain-containing protein n=1 Tax=Actinomarinicola tropica TaxID=2789776 RepID=A0A5Q2RRW6_9ACTN|nr:hypothetical protein [Actinomarinicola tropica]QGG95935.1 hypothetical protein GH723_12975 [Actinomarinicola tropica]